MTTYNEYDAMRQAAWEAHQYTTLQDDEAQFKRAWERGYQDAVREMRKQDVKQAALIRAAMGTVPLDANTAYSQIVSLDPFPWIGDAADGQRHHYKYRGSIIGRAVWAPRPKYEQDINRYPESQYGRRREGDQ